MPLACLAGVAAAGPAAAATGGNRIARTDKVATRAGQLSIEDGRRVVLGGRRIEIEDASFIHFEYVADLPEADVVLVEIGSGGNACSSEWVFLTVKASGEAAVSRRFGNCSPEATVKRSGDPLHVHVAPSGANPAQNVTYADGIVRCDTCIPDVTKDPVRIAGGVVTILREGGMDELLVNGRPTGIKAKIIYRIGQPIRMETMDVLLIQRCFVSKRCEARFLFVAIDEAGALSASKEFGNCTGFPSVEVGPGSIDVSFPDVQGHRAERYVYRDGLVAPGN